jgi:hypothetical protein
MDHCRQFERVEQEIRHARSQIANQIDIIERLATSGRDTRVAEDVLEILRLCQTIHIKHRDLLLREIQGEEFAVELHTRSRVAIATGPRSLDRQFPSLHGGSY